MTASHAEAAGLRDDSVDEPPVDPRRRLELLEDCREFVIERLAKVIGEALDKIGDELTALALRDTRRNSQQALLDAVTLVRRHRGDIESRFHAIFADIFERRVQGDEASGDAENEPTGELALVDDSVIRERIAIDRLVQRARSKLDPDEVLGVRARMGVLVERDWFEENRHPASPEAVFEALRRTLGQMDAETDVREALLQAFEPHVSANLNTVYANVNERLRSNRILPRIKPRVVNAASQAPQHRPPAAPVALQQHGGQASARPGSQSQWAAGAQTAPPHGWQASAGFVHGRGAVAEASVGSHDGSASVPGPAGGADPSAHGAAYADGDALLAELSRRLSGDAATARGLVAQLLGAPDRAGAEAAPIPSVEPALLAALHRIQNGAGQSASAGSEVLAALLAQFGDETSSLDRLTVEVVSFVFDRIYADHRLPDTVKQQLLRLQVVAIRAALIDRGFFARRDHPMRRLLDAFCEAATDPDAEVDARSGLMSGIVEIVDSVLASFDDDLSVFQDAAMRLDMIVSIEAQRRSERILELEREARRLEALAIAQEQARAEIALRVDPSTPAFMQAFLDRWWSKVVAAARVDGSAGGWAASLRCAEALVWSVTVSSPEEIPQLASLLPKLIGELNRGLPQSGIDDAGRQVFFDELLRCHTHAIEQAKYRAPTAAANGGSFAAGGAATGGAGSTAGRDGSAASAAGAVAPDSGLQPISPRVARQLGELHRGDLVEMLDSDGVRRCLRLAWVGPSRKLFMLTRAPSVVRPVGYAELARWFETGRIRLAESSTSLDRAIAAVGSFVDARGRAPASQGARH